MPKRLESITEIETIVCSPNGSSVPSVDEAAQSGNDRVFPSRDSPIPSKNRTPADAVLKTDSLDSSSSDIVV